MLTLTPNRYLLPMEEWDPGIGWNEPNPLTRYIKWSAYLERPRCVVAIDIHEDDAYVAVWFGGWAANRPGIPNILNETYTIPHNHILFCTRVAQCLYMYASDPLV
jgi:hypothetical protein